MRKNSFVRERLLPECGKIRSRGNACIASRVVQETVRTSNMIEEVRRIGEEAKSLAHDIASYHIGKVSPPPNQTAAILRRLTDELEDRHSAVLSNMCNRLNVVRASAQSKFVQVADEVFRDGVNWGRIVAIFASHSIVCEKGCKKTWMRLFCGSEIIFQVYLRGFIHKAAG